MRSNQLSYLAIVILRCKDISIILIWQIFHHFSSKKIQRLIKNIEYLAKKTAREVAKTKVEAKLDSMNSYERRIVHSILSDDKYVYTESIGEEPNRCVVIKPKEM